MCQDGVRRAIHEFRKKILLTLYDLLMLFYSIFPDQATCIWFTLPAGGWVCGEESEVWGLQIKFSKIF